jgi:response regulator RpfG family c-di-GMP phosphodiesterase
MPPRAARANRGGARVGFAAANEAINAAAPPVAPGEPATPRRRLASLESDLAAERSTRKQSELQWEDQLSSHKERLGHSLEAAQRTMAERESQLEAEAKRLQAELQQMSEERRAERAQHADRETEWSTKMADYQARLALTVQKEHSAAQARDIHVDRV